MYDIPRCKKSISQPRLVLVNNFTNSINYDHQSFHRVIISHRQIKNTSLICTVYLLDSTSQ